MKYSKQVWDQIKGIHVEKLVKALEKDGFKRERTGASSGGNQLYRHPDGRKVNIHVHPKKTFGAWQLKQILEAIQWSEDNLVRLKLVKKK